MCRKSQFTPTLILELDAPVVSHQQIAALKQELGLQWGDDARREHLVDDPMGIGWRLGLANPPYCVIQPLDLGRVSFRKEFRQLFQRNTHRSSSHGGGASKLFRNNAAIRFRFVGIDLPLLTDFGLEIKESNRELLCEAMALQTRRENGPNPENSEQNSNISASARYQVRCSFFC